MTENAQVNQGQITENRPSDKELNFRALEAKYQRQLEQERSEKERLSRELDQRNRQVEVEEEDSEPYVDHKKLEKKLSKFGQNTQSEIQKAMEMAKMSAKEELKQEMWLENNPDFYQTLQHAEAFAQRAPKLAETILRMPDNFERQKLVYQNIKELGIDKPKTQEPSIQEKIDANRRSPYYQASSVSNAPSAMQGDFSEQGQKQAYAKMQEMKNRLRM